MTNDRDDGPMDEFDEGLGDRLRAEFPAGDFPRDRIEQGIRQRIDAAERDERGMARETPDATRAVRSGAEGWSSLWMRSVLPAAAALVVFIGGTEYGRRTASTMVVEPLGAPAALQRVAADPGTPDQPPIPFDIQESGSRYVASLTRLGGVTGELTPEDRLAAREVALTVFYAALSELLDESGGDQGLRGVLRVIGEQRARLAEEASVRSF